MTDKQIIIDDLMKQLNEKTVAIMLLRETLDRKEQECEELKGISIKKCPKCGEVYLNSVGMEAFNQLDQLKAQLLDQEAETLKAGGIIHKLEKTLTEIKEIATCCIEGDVARIRMKQILQKNQRGGNMTNELEKQFLILKNLTVPTGNICIMQADKGKLEFVSLQDYGKAKNIKADFLGYTKEINQVPHGKLLPLTDKWVVTVSTQYGCSMNCKFCDVPKVGKGLNATYDDLKNQILSALFLHPEIKSTKRLKNIFLIIT